MISSRTVPFASRVVARSGKEMVQRDRERAQKVLAGMHPHGPLAIRELRRTRRHHGHHHGHKGEGEGDASSGTGTGGAGTGSGTGSEPTSGAGTGVDVTDAGVTYTASVGVGSPATQYRLLIDTGMFSY